MSNLTTASFIFRPPYFVHIWGTVTGLYNGRVSCRSPKRKKEMHFFQTLTCLVRALWFLFLRWVLQWLAFTFNYLVQMNDNKTQTAGVSCKGNSARCLQWRYCNNFHDLFSDISSSLEAGPVTSSSVVRKKNKKTKQIQINNLWVQYRLAVWIMKYGPDLFHILLCRCHLLGACAPGIPASLLHLLNKGTDLPLQLTGWSGGPHGSKVRILHRKTEY